jgi:hypothetical protein
MELYFYDVEFVFEHMVILVNVGFATPPDELEDTDSFVIESATPPTPSRKAIRIGIFPLLSCIEHVNQLDLNATNF